MNHDNIIPEGAIPCEKHIAHIKLVDDMLKDAGTLNLNLFGMDKSCYVVPVYQRAFAWGTDNSGKRQNEIIQLMDDVLSAYDAKKPYYLGSLIVSKLDGKNGDGEFIYEVIDGQQRLTALYMIFKSIGFDAKERFTKVVERWFQEHASPIRTVYLVDLEGGFSK